MQNISELIFRALAATTTTTASTLKLTARKATLAAAAAVVATSASISTTTHTARLASAAAATAFASSNAVSWAAENFYDEVDVYFASAYINDSWIAINNNNSVGNGGGNNMNVNVNSSIIANNDNSTTSISYYDDINQTALINDTGVVKGVYGHINDTNATIANEVESEELAAFIKMLALSILLGLMILITIIGNVFVIAAIMLERNLQNVANYLVASLAVADLFVACLVMPLGAVYEISQGWILGPELCDIWTCCDVLCCTASILHLVAIASDRYWTVTNIDYTNFRTPRRVFFMILLVWLAAVVVSLAPQFGWKDPEYMERIKHQKCMVSQDVGYQIFATCSTFYVPLLVILVLYWKIYKIARKRIQRRRHRPHFSVLQANNTNHQTEKQLKKLRKKEKKAQKLRDQQLAASEAVDTQQQQQEMLEKVNLPQKSKRQKRLKICFGISSSAATTSEATQIPTTIVVQPTTLPTTTMVATEAIAVITTTTTTTTTTSATNGHNGVTISAATTMDCAGATLTDNRPLTALGVHTLGGGGEELEYSTSNFDSKSHGTEVTTISSDADEQQTPQSNSEIITISHQVASSHNQKQELEKQQFGEEQLASNTADISLNVPAGGISSEPNSGEVGVNKLLTSIPNPLSKLAKRRQLLEARRERKAAQTLAIITGAFVVCWLPFFVMALLLPLCKDCDVDPIVASVFLWLGYFNSTLNPVIYTVFNPEFRRAFQRIVYGRNSMPQAAASRKM